MANEKRLIDANELLGKMHRMDEQQKTDVWMTSDIEALLEMQPTVDAVEVIRCKDCKAYDKESYYCEAMGFTCEADDFCSYGERKDKE